MRTVWKDIATIINTACISGIVCYERCRDSDLSFIAGLVIFIGSLMLYLLFQTIWRKNRKRG